MVYQLTKGEAFEADRDLRWQLRSSAVSPMSNIAEAFGRYSFEDKRRFLDIALGSCKEVQSHLYVAIDQGYITRGQFRETYDQAETVGKLVTGSLASLENQLTNRRPDRRRSRPGTRQSA